MTLAEAHLQDADLADKASQAAPVVRAEGICLSLDDRPILREISLDVAAGRTVVLMGANGAGKSTLLRVLATLTPPTAGRLELFGLPARRNAAGVRRRIGLLAHQPMLYRDLSARENLEFFARLYDVPRPRRRAEAMLDLVGLSARAGDPVKTLSRGMTQRVAIARALVHEPDLLLADEPFDGLDAPSSAALTTLLGRLRSAGKTVVFSHHDIARGLELADRAVVLSRGRLVLHEPAASLSPSDVLREVSRA